MSAPSPSITPSGPLRGADHGSCEALLTRAGDLHNLDDRLDDI